MTDALSSICKLLLDEERLKIIGYLAAQPANSSELAGVLKQKPATVIRHLGKLQAAGLVLPAKETQYQLNLKQLTEFKKQLFLAENGPVQPPQTPEEKILRSFIEGERLKGIPAKHAKLLVVLAWLAEKFEGDVRYSERAVNEIIQHHHPDYASLRRFLVDYGWMKREKGVYWRT